MIRTNQTHKNYIGTKPVIAEVNISFYPKNLTIYRVGLLESLADGVLLVMV